MLVDTHIGVSWFHCPNKTDMKGVPIVVITYVGLQGQSEQYLAECEGSHLHVVDGGSSVWPSLPSRALCGRTAEAGYPPHAPGGHEPDCNYLLLVLFDFVEIKKI